MTVKPVSYTIYTKCANCVTFVYFYVSFLSRISTDSRYWYSNSGRLSVCTSVTFRYQM